MKQITAPAIVAVLALLATFSLSLLTIKKLRPILSLTPSSSPSQASTLPKSSSPGRLYLSDQNEIILEAPGTILSGVALRLTIELDSALKTTPPIEINKALVDAGWNFPIKDAVLESNRLTIDLAALDISPEGYPIENEITLAAINLVDSTHMTNYTFSSDLTKVIAKNGQELSISHQ